MWPNRVGVLPRPHEEHRWPQAACQTLPVPAVRLEATQKNSLHYPFSHGELGSIKKVFTPTRPSHSLTLLAVNSGPLSLRMWIWSGTDRLGNGLTSPHLDFDTRSIGDDLLGQFFLSAWHGKPSFGCDTDRISLWKWCRYKEGRSMEVGIRAELGSAGMSILVAGCWSSKRLPRERWGAGQFTPGSLITRLA